MVKSLTILFFSLALNIGFLLTFNVSKAQTLLNNFGDWSAFSDGKGTDKICYTASVPKKEKGKYKSRGNTYILVTHRPIEKKRDIFEMRAGYIFRKDSQATLNIDGQFTILSTGRGSAWADDKAEPKILKMMIRGKSMVVVGFSTRGTKVEDIYSLIGFTSAYQAISKACGFK
jgi:hypothetical protein